MRITEEKRRHLEAVAEEFVADPDKGFRAGYRPRRTVIPNPERGMGLDREPDIIIPLGKKEWLVAVCEKEMPLGVRWTIVSDPEGGADLVLL